MAKVGVQRATELTGKSKSTIQRAMKAGKLSYEVDGSRKLIDVSELDRVYGTAMSSEVAVNTKASPSYEAELQKAKHALETDRLEMKVKMLEDQLDISNQTIEDIKIQRDSWQKQAQQVLLTSQHSQKQSDDRIAEMREREEARAKAALQAKRQQEIQRQKMIAVSNQNKNNHSLFKALFTKSKKAS